MKFLNEQLDFLKKGSGIHIKKENRGKFTDYCGGKVTSECIAKGKRSSSATIRKRATFADNARHFKHHFGGNIEMFKNPSGPITAKLKAKTNLDKRKAPDWDNLDRGYRYLTLDMKLPHDLAIAIMGNVVEESRGNYKTIQKNGGGRGLIQWDGRSAPKGRYGQWRSIWNSVAEKANVYDPDTDTVKNYWAPWNGLKGEQVRQKFISAPLRLKAKIYAESYLRPGKPRINDRVLSTMQLDSIYNPKIKNIVVQLKKVGGKLFSFLEGGNIGNSLLNISNGIANTVKVNDWALKAKKALQTQKEVDKKLEFNKLFLTKWNEKLQNPVIDINGSPIHTNGVNVANEAYNLAINSFNFDETKYNNQLKEIEEQALQMQNLGSQQMTNGIGSIISSIGGISGKTLNNTSFNKNSNNTTLSLLNFNTIGKPSTSGANLSNTNAKTFFT